MWPEMTIKRPVAKRSKIPMPMPMRWRKEIE
jgi:hypothetical protein